MGKVDENKLQKQQSLYETAFSLFTSQGVAKTSITDIVNRAGIAKGTFYLYFRDKFDLEEKLVIHKSNELLEHAMKKTKSLASANLEEYMVCLVNDVIDQLEQNPRLLRFINKNLSWGIFRRSVSRAQTDYTCLFFELASKGTVTYDHPDLLLYTIIEFVSSISYSLILERDPVDMTTYRPLLNQTLRAIIRSYEHKTEP